LGIWRLALVYTTRSFKKYCQWIQFTLPILLGFGSQLRQNDSELSISFENLLSVETALSVIDDVELM